MIPTEAYCFIFEVKHVQSESMMHIIGMRVDFSENINARPI